MRLSPAEPLGALVEILSGFAFDANQFGEDGPIPIVRIRDVGANGNRTFYRGSYDSRYILNDGDMLIAMDGEFRRARWEGGVALLNQRVCRIRPSKPNLDERYLFHFLPRALQQIEAATPFATVKHLSTKTIAQIQIPLPPLTEQRRIADILDKADALRSKRRTSLAQISAVQHSIFWSMFGDPLTNPLSWPTAPLGDLARIIRGASPRPKGDPRYFGGAIPWLMISDVTSTPGKVIITTKQHVTEAGRDRSVYLPAGTLVLTNSATVGVPKILGVPLCIHDGFLAFLDVDDRIQQDFLYEFFRIMRSHLSSLAPEGTQKNLNTGIAKGVRMIVPPLHLQKTFADRIRVLGLLGEGCRASLTHLDALFSSLQHRAFRGEL